MANTYRLRAKDSVTAGLYFWTGSDATATGYPGPNVATDLVTLGVTPVTASAALTEVLSPNFLKTFQFTGSVVPVDASEVLLGAITTVIPA